MFNWPVVPICDKQLRDVRQEDLLEEGLYRKCNTLRGGGGYDQFPGVCQHIYGVRPTEQFVVQLRGCNLECPYCYVTPDGIFGEAVKVTTTDLVKAFQNSRQEMFHLMGGAPALYLDYWPELINALRLNSLTYSTIFHSDLNLVERSYHMDTLNKLAKLSGTLYAVNIKGLNAEDWKANTGCAWNGDLFWSNWRNIQKVNLPFYVTFTNVDPAELDSFWECAQSHGISMKYRKYAFVIDLVDYDALR